MQWAWFGFLQETCNLLNKYSTRYVTGAGPVAGEPKGFTQPHIIQLITMVPLDFTHD